MNGLKRRSEGIRESGGFLLGGLAGNKVQEIVFYDQFDIHVSDSGIIQFKGANVFYQYLAKNDLQVLADIHTHPYKDTIQSESDKTHPMIRIKGHIAIIAPYYAQRLWTLPKNCSFYKYQGNFKWEKTIPIILKMI
jgi:proteasome lid subunit RPN8/RPN11